MVERARNFLKQLRWRVRTTAQVVVDVAQTVGLPEKVTSWLRLVDGTTAATGPLGQDVQVSSAAPSARAAKPSGDGGKSNRPRRTGVRKKRSLAAGQQLPAGVCALESDAAIGGSTYLARIVWALGVARAEGAGALKPADIARMVMARSAVSLEPPNVARYIRRSKPTCIKVDRKEGSSSFYRLNAEGRRLFDEHFSLPSMTGG